MESQLFPDLSKPEISAKSTKNEILEAYQSLLGTVTASKNDGSNQEPRRKKQEEEVIAKVSETTLERIVNNIATVKISTSHALDTLEQKLSEEFKRFSDLQAAIKIASTELEEVHDIKKSADSLTALFLAHKEYKARFEQDKEAQKKAYDHEIAEVRSVWHKEQEETVRDNKEAIAKIKKDRTREEEEYQYSTHLQRKKDLDDYTTKKAALEKEIVEKKASFDKTFAEREAAIKTQEDELKQLKIRVEQFPQELERTVKNAEKVTRETLEREHRYHVALTAKDAENDKRLAEQMIASLQAKIKEQDDLIRQLTEKTDEAGDQVQAIALKALEGASNMRFYGGMVDEKAKTSNT